MATGRGSADPVATHVTPVDGSPIQGPPRVDRATAEQAVQAFEVGVNKPRSRGDREEVFGGLGESWKGAFVDGDLLVQAVTMGPEGDGERLFGNFPDHSLYPSR